MQAHQCLNCKAALAPDFTFCPYCSQGVHQHRLNLAHLGHEVVHFFTHADKGVFYLVKMLATRPGRVIREYIAGRRKVYFSPLNFFLIVLGLMVFFMSTFRPLDAVDLTALKTQTAKEPDPVVRARRLAKVDRMENAYGFMARHSNLVNLSIVPLTALVFFLFYYRSGYNYTEHLVAQLYITGFNALVMLLIVLPFALFVRGTPYVLVGLVLFFIWEVGYRSLAYYRFLNRPGTGRYLKALAASLTVTVGWFLLSTSLIRYYIEHGL